jgi:hypothetical protein
VAILLTMTSWVCSQRATAQGPQSTGSSTASMVLLWPGTLIVAIPSAMVTGGQAGEMAVRDLRQLGEHEQAPIPLAEQAAGPAAAG